MNEAQQTIQHLRDLDARAYARGYTVYSEFLNLNEISLLKGSMPQSSVRLYGGYEGAERCIAAFGDDGSTQDFPLCCLCIAPVNQRFSDQLSHRDILGALMNLGINRNTLGDILLRENTAYLFCLKSISTYITDSLTRVRHTTVQVSAAETIPAFVTAPPEVTALTVASLRADAVVAGVYRLSRHAVSQLFAEGRVFINARECTKEAAMLNDGDIVSVRGFGRFIFVGEARRTKKDRAVIEVRIYQ